MAFDKSPPELVALFAALCPPDPVTSRPMFGYPCAFYAGNMFLGLFEDKLWVRLDADQRVALSAVGGTPFEPMKGRPMKEYVVVPKGWHTDPDWIRPWVARAQAYAATLSPKPLHQTSKARRS